MVNAIDDYAPRAVPWLKRASELLAVVVLAAMADYEDTYVLESSLPDQVRRTGGPLAIAETRKKRRRR